MLKQLLKITAGLLLALSFAVSAATLPDPLELQRLLGPAQVVTVVEPHLSVKGREVKIAYRGYPAGLVLASLFGADWKLQPDREIEFIALDGYRSRIPVGRFSTYQAFLVFARADGSAFRVDNLEQREKAVPLAPYYLVWDNIAAPELLAEGGNGWPYQVAQISLRQSGKDALLPGAMAAQWSEHAALAQKYCLSCHRVNGFGGDKMPINLAERAKLIDARSWQTWLLAPQSVKPDTTMPALPEGRAAREQLAAKLQAYLKALPVSP